MPEIKNLTKVLRAFEKLERESKRKNNGNVIVGFNASYALFVHESVAMKLKGQPRGGKNAGRDKGTGRFTKGFKGKKGKYWDPQGRGQAKFLEGPAREMQGEIAATIVKAVKGGAPLIKALLIAGLRLQREAQKRVPVDTANLKGSAFTERE